MCSPFEIRLFTKDSTVLPLRDKLFLVSIFEGWRAFFFLFFPDSTHAVRIREVADLLISRPSCSVLCLPTTSKWTCVPASQETAGERAEPA